jgi:sterol 3beta-glucosyltransferase
LGSSVLGTITDFTSALGGTFVDPFKEVKHVRASGNNERGSASGAAAVAAGQGVMRMTTAVTKGALVDVPRALTEGLRNAPRLLGEEVRDHGEVKDWKKGCVVAAKVCVMIRVSSLLWS